MAFYLAPRLLRCYKKVATEALNEIYTISFRPSMDPDSRLPGEDEYAFVRYTDKPDRDVEYFWYLFKAVIINMAREEKLGRDFLDLDPTILPLTAKAQTPTVATQVKFISSYLNSLQKAALYSQIQDTIVNVFEDLAFALIMAPSPSQVAFARMVTFAKRWDGWADSSFRLNGKSSLVSLLHIGLVSFRCSAEERAGLMPHLQHAASSHGVDMGPLFDYGVEIGRPSILDRILLVEDMSNHIQLRYGVKVSPRTKGVKLVRALQNLSFDEKSE
jgi:hypothetical protein